MLRRADEISFQLEHTAQENDGLMDAHHRKRVSFTEENNSILMALAKFKKNKKQNPHKVYKVILDLRERRLFRIITSLYKDNFIAISYSAIALVIQDT